MRIVCFAFAAMVCTVGFAQMATASEPATPTQTQEESSENDRAQQGANEENAAEMGSKREPLLHRHPTLLSMLRRNNEIRRRLGLMPHRINPALTKAAQDHANYMARTGDFQHYSNGGPQYRAGKYGFRGGVRENIAYNYRSVEDAFSVWQGSSGHYASIVSGTTEAGFGYAIGPNGAIYYVGVYGSAAAGDQTGEDEELALKLAAAEQAAGEGAVDAAETMVDKQVVPAAAQEPVAEEAVAAESQAAVEQPQQVQTYQSNRSRGIFSRRRR